MSQPTNLVRYVVRLDGYTDEYFTASSLSRARYQGYKAFREAVPGVTFRDFLNVAYVFRAGDAQV